MRDSHIIAVEALECDSDAVAILLAESMLSEPTFEIIEIWEGARKVGVVERR